MSPDQIVKVLTNVFWDYAELARSYPRHWTSGYVSQWGIKNKDGTCLRRLASKLIFSLIDSPYDYIGQYHNWFIGGGKQFQ